MPRSRPPVAARSSSDRIRECNAAYTARKDFVARPNAFLKQFLEHIAPRKKSRPRRLALDM
jgi:hypothetical protein